MDTRTARSSARDAPVNALLVAAAASWPVVVVVAGRLIGRRLREADDLQEAHRTAGAEPPLREVAPGSAPDGLHRGHPAGHDREPRTCGQVPAGDDGR
ncbi:protein of unknown function [Modestobacter italicus]|uniref:Uncharacterized protein n=1 Tax=Modestobacter italicus (strain DSM 44449 / CECT 9708 / BC 501) TaxID=2732864 RepID=I4EXL5_MODI5|nr:hypothetical protein [Modestobacter marinus]CCH88128.1 protein of unknown function [Modestobacter marinus]